MNTQVTRGKISWALLVSIQLVLILFSCRAYAEVVQVKSLLQTPSEYVNRVVDVEGVVDRWIEKAENDKAGFYVLKDNFGDSIKVQTIEPNPPVGQYCKITGLLSKGPRRNDFYIQSRNIILLAKEADKPYEKSIEKPQPVEVDKQPSQEGFLEKIRRFTGSIYSVLVYVALFMLAVAIIVVLLKRHYGSPMPLESPTMSGDDAKTIRIDLEGKIVSGPDIDEKTQKLLIGYFEVTDGMEAAKGQRLYIPGLFTMIGREERGKDKSKGWITFPSDHSTVSRHQADLIFEEGNYVIVNHATVNSTVVNGKALGDGKKIRIKDGDQISFGNIELTFRASK